jgi:tetratricopeptide (TPR) repeat protein
MKPHVGLLFAALAGMLLAAGCGGSGPAQREVGSGTTGAEDAAVRQKATRHAIDASTYEVKGEYADAILEWQDALRYSNDPGIAFALARDYAILKKYPQAIEWAHKAVEIEPKRAQFRRLLADVLVAAYRYDEAVREYREVIRCDSTDADAWFNLARLLQARDPAAALAAYEVIIDRFGPQWEVLTQAADLYNRTGRFDKASSCLQKLIELDPSNQGLRISLAQTLVRAGLYDDALKAYADVVAMTGPSLELEIDVAGVYLFKKDYVEAHRRFEQIQARDSVGLDDRLRIGDMHYGMLERDSTIGPEAVRVFSRIQQRYPAEWQSYWFLGLIGSALHNDSLALTNFRGMTERAPNNADGWVSLASVHLGKNDFAEIARILEPVHLKIDNDFRIPFLLGIAYSRLERQEDATIVLERARALNPRSVDVITQLALVYDGLRRFGESDSLYEMALVLDPDNHLALNNFAYSLAERDTQLERALAMSTRAVAAQPENASYLDTIGWIYYRLGNYRRALEEVSKAVTKGEASAVVIEHLGDIHFKLGDRVKALEYWKRALGLDANNTALRGKVDRGEL